MSYPSLSVAACSYFPSTLRNNDLPNVGKCYQTESRLRHQWRNHKCCHFLLWHIVCKCFGFYTHAGRPDIFGSSKCWNNHHGNSHGYFHMVLWSWCQIFSICLLSNIWCRWRPYVKLPWCPRRQIGDAFPDDGPFIDNTFKRKVFHAGITIERRTSRK